MIIAGIGLASLMALCLGIQVKADVDAGLAVYRSHGVENATRVYEGEAFAWNGDAVEDKDAANGMAQRGLPLKHEQAHAYLFCSGHETTLPPGRYQVVFRLKIAAKPEKPLPVCDLLAYNHSGVGNQRLFYEQRPLTTADFAQAGVYQDFTINLERYDIAFAAIAAAWKKQVELYVDHVALIQEHPFSDAELCAKDNMKGLLAVDATPGKRFLVVAGPYHRSYRLGEALKKLAGSRFDVCQAVKSNLAGESLNPDFPGSAQLAGYDAVILLDVPAGPLHLAGRLALKRYVENGGALLVAGGPFALGKGGYAGTFLEELLPTSIDGPKGFRPASAELKLSGGQLLDGLFPKGNAMVGWLHEVSAKPGATVLMEAGGKPVLAIGDFGKGRVAVLAATPVGEGTLFESECWPKLLSRLLLRITDKTTTPNK